MAIFLPGLGFLAHPLCKAASGLLMLLAAYGGSRRLLRQGILFVALTCALGGGVVAIGLLGGQGLALGNGVFYSALDLKMVLLSAAVLLCGAEPGAAAGLAGTRPRPGELLPARLSLEGRTAELTAWWTRGIP